MTLKEYKAQYPIDQVFMQVDNTERNMTPEEYETWCVDCVEYINTHPDGPV